MWFTVASRSRAVSEPSLKTYQSAADTAPLEYLLYRSGRRTLLVSVRAGQVIVRAPAALSQKRIETRLHELLPWIAKHCTQQRDRLEQIQRQKVQPCEGALFPYRGGHVVISTRQAVRETRLREQDGTVYLDVALPHTADSQSLMPAMTRWLYCQAQQVLGERLERAQQLTGVSICSWRLSNARSRWGSCSGRGVIALSWRLIFLDDALIDYVLIHELMHRHEMNHGPAFWALVTHFCPDWRERAQKIKQIGETLPDCPALPIRLFR